MIRADKRWLYFLILLLLVAWPLLLGLNNEKDEGKEAVVVGGKVFSTKCAPCHLNLDDFRNPNLIFKHSYHILFPCSSCHEEYPHQVDKTLRPPMRVCLACHGLSHSGQEMARGDCLACHYRAEKPAFHTSRWEKSEHKEALPSGCTKCHQPLFCEDCHQREGVKPLPSESYGIPVPSTLTLPFNISPPITMEKCASCHLDLDAFKNPTLIFKHSPHLERGFTCSSCHVKPAHQADRNDRPAMEVCYACHGLKHREQGLVASEECSLCHPPNFKDLPQDHTRRFIRKDHAEKAEENLAYCYICHKSEFCQSCHNQKKAKPKDHERLNWRETHGRGKYEKLVACDPCHSQAFCRRCHITPVPHPLNWVAYHEKPGEQYRQDCNICHAREHYCDSCHHPYYSKLALLPKNCKNCHSNITLSKETLYQAGLRGIVIHRVHFPTSSQSRVWECLSCHDPRVAIERLFDFTTCEKCHGARDEYGRIIARLSGDRLCLTCHPYPVLGQPQ